MKKQELKLEIPERLLKQLTEIAKASGQDINDVIIQTIKGGMPPSLRKVPNKFHRDLLSLNALGDLELWDIVAMPQKRNKKKSEEEVADIEHFSSLKKAYAFSLLKWRGHPVPSPSEFAFA